VAVTGDTQRVNELLSAAPVGARRQPSRVIMAIVPIGLWSVSLVVNVASRVQGAPGIFAEISMPLLGLGVFAALVAAMVGFVDLLAIPPGTPVFTASLVHMVVNLAVIGSYIYNFCWRDAIFFETVPVPVGPLVLSAVSLTVLVVVTSLCSRPPSGTIVRSNRREVRRPEVRRLPR
jgi:uncharacterized membrane protein